MHAGKIHYAILHPLALHPSPRRRMLWEGFGWPLRAFAEYKNGSLMEDDSKITVSGTAGAYLR